MELCDTSIDNYCDCVPLYTMVLHPKTFLCLECHCGLTILWIGHDLLQVVDGLIDIEVEKVRDIGQVAKYVFGTFSIPEGSDCRSSRRSTPDDDTRPWPAKKGRSPTLPQGCVIAR